MCRRVNGLRKKTCAPTQSERAGATALKASRYHGSLQRRPMITQSAARATVAGPGPKRIADAMRNLQFGHAARRGSAAGAWNRTGP